MSINIFEAFKRIESLRTPRYSKPMNSKLSVPKIHRFYETKHAKLKPATQIETNNWDINGHVRCTISYSFTKKRTFPRTECLRVAPENSLKTPWHSTGTLRAALKQLSRLPNFEKPMSC